MLGSEVGLSHHQKLSRIQHVVILRAGSYPCAACLVRLIPVLPFKVDVAPILKLHVYQFLFDFVAYRREGRLRQRILRFP